MEVKGLHFMQTFYVTPDTYMYVHYNSSYKYTVDVEEAHIEKSAYLYN